MSRPNKYTEINYSVLKTGDVVICGGVGPIGYFVRMFTAGFKKRHDSKVSTHTAIVVEFHGQKLIAEMKGTTGKIELSSLEEYLINRRRFIIDIRRFLNMEDHDRQMIAEQIAYDLRKGLEYDYKGLAEFIFKKAEDDKNKNYCSEYFYALTDACDKFYTEAQRTKFNRKISPLNIQLIDSLFPVNWRKD